MILYTVMPQELIYPTDEAQFSNIHYVEMNGISMIVEKSEDQKYRVVRLLSTDPQHYLNEQYLPGSIISVNH